MSDAEVDDRAAIYFSVSATFFIELSIPEVEETYGAGSEGLEVTF
jgi:hypothetical protein